MKRLPDTNGAVEAITMDQVKMWTTLATIMGVVACSSGEPVSIGADQGNPKAKTGETLADYGAEWDGYLEAAAFESGSDAMHITLDAEGHGYLLVGDGPLLDPPTDPDAPYLTMPGEPVAQLYPQQNLFEGFKYTIRDALVEARRLRFSIDWQEPYDAWCELQTSYLVETQSPPGYRCVDNYHGGIRTDHTCYLGSDTHPTEISCTQLNLCLGSTCTCTEDGCTGSQKVEIALDAALTDDANELTGTLAVDPPHTVHLTRH